MTMPVPEQQPEIAAVTVRPAPRREPPFDDDVAARHLHAIGPHDQPLPFPRPPLRRVQPPADPFGIRITGRGDLTDPGPWARRLVVALIETLAGRRSVNQLAPFTSPAVHNGLTQTVERTVRHPSGRDWAAGASVRSIRVCEPADGVAEVALTVQTPVRVRAIALRMEGLDGKWRCTRLQIG